MGTVSKFGDKVKKIKRNTTVAFQTDEGEVVEFAVESRSSEQLEALSEKYDAMKPPVPSKKVPSGKSFKVVEFPEQPEYKKEVAKINKAHFNHMALLFLAEEERPEGTEDEQLEQIAKVELAGFTNKIVNKGLEISALTNDEDDEVAEERKN